MHLGLLTALLIQAVQALNFPYESIQLSDSDISQNPAVAFAVPSASNSHYDGPDCRAFPGSDDWPTDSEWNALNETLEGNLLKPLPVGNVCYQGPTYDAAKCGAIVNTSFLIPYYDGDPVSTLTQWPEGDTCVASLTAQGNCTQGGFPVYVVNATTVKHVQAGVNFARNKGVRLVIKNTGHDFGGRSVGAGSLSIWTHNLKSTEFLPEYTQGQYSGMAVRIGAGIQTGDYFNLMTDNNIAMVAPGPNTVGVGGGWMGSGGHGNLASYYGLGSDQVLSAQVVTADGRFVTADPQTNEDLFFAIRGGGAATYGVLTSLVMKAYPSLNTTTSTVSFSIGPRGTLAPNQTELFWQGVNLHYKFIQKFVSSGAYVWGYVYSLGNGTFTLTSTPTFPGKTTAEVYAFMQPLYDDLNHIGINVTNPTFIFSSPYATHRPQGGASPAETRYRSRLIGRDNWADEALFNKTMGAVRKSAEGGYNVHLICLSPTNEVAGWPGSTSSIHPAWRSAICHGSLVTTQHKMTAQEARDEEANILTYTNLWREVTPGGGAYLNEGDPGEPNWQQAFFGDNYPRLLEIKRKHDPWGVFWRQTGVGNEDWEVQAVDDYPHSQNGRLCRVDS